MPETYNKINHYETGKNTLVQLQKLNLDNALEKRLVDVMNTQDQKIQALSDELLNDNNCLKDESDMIRLAVIVKSLEKTKAFYNHLKISDDIFYDTMSDIRIWCENNGNRGLHNDQWLANHIKGVLFKIGRLQYQLYTCKNKTLDYTRLPFDYGEDVLYIHIPQGEKLIYENSMASIDKAKDFFKIYFPSYHYRYFFCESWLLFEGNSSFMKENSNIIKFSSLFDIAYSDWDDKQAIERIFGERKQNIADYPEKTSLQKTAKKYLLDGNKLGSGIGTIKA